MVPTLTAYGVASLPVLISAVVLAVVGAVVVKRRSQLGRPAKFVLLLGFVAQIPLVYIVEGKWLGRYGLATMHLIEVCGPSDGIRSAWRHEASRAGSLDADGFFWCGTGLDDPRVMCTGSW